MWLPACCVAPRREQQQFPLVLLELLPSCTLLSPSPFVFEAAPPTFLQAAARPLQVSCHLSLFFPESLNQMCPQCREVVCPPQFSRPDTSPTSDKTPAKAIAGRNFAQQTGGSFVAEQANKEQTKKPMLGRTLG